MSEYTVTLTAEQEVLLLTGVKDIPTFLNNSVLSKLAICENQVVPPPSGGGSGLVYVDRGSLVVNDFTKDDFTKDGGWHDLSLRSKITEIPANAVMVKLRRDLATVSVSNVYWDMRPEGYPGTANNYPNNVHSISYHHGVVQDIPIGLNGIIEYRCSAVEYSFLDASVQGWWIPAS